MSDTNLHKSDNRIEVFLQPQPDNVQVVIATHSHEKQFNFATDVDDQWLLVVYDLQHDALSFAMSYSPEITLQMCSEVTRVLREMKHHYFVISICKRGQLLIDDVQKQSLDIMLKHMLGRIPEELWIAQHETAMADGDDAQLSIATYAVRPFALIFDCLSRLANFHIDTNIDNQQQEDRKQKSVWLNLVQDPYRPHGSLVDFDVRGTLARLADQSLQHRTLLVDLNQEVMALKQQLYEKEKKILQLMALSYIRKMERILECRNRTASADSLDVSRLNLDRTLLTPSFSPLDSPLTSSSGWIPAGSDKENYKLHYTTIHLEEDCIITAIRISVARYEVPGEFPQKYDVSQFAVSYSTSASNDPAAEEYRFANRGKSFEGCRVDRDSSHAENTIMFRDELIRARHIRLHIVDYTQDRPGLRWDVIGVTASEVSFITDEIPG